MAMGSTLGSADMTKKSRYIALAVVSQLLWGTYPALSRYLQTRVPGEPSASAVLAAVLVIALVAIVIDVARLIAERHAAATVTTSRATESALPASPLSPWPPCAAAVRGLVIYCLFTLGRMGMNMVACGLTYAYINALVMLTQPFTVAALERALFGTAMPPGLGRLLFLSTAGSLLVISAQSGLLGSATTPVDTRALGRRDYAGIALQFLSILCSTGGRLTVKGTKKLATRHELLMAQFGFTAALLGGVTAAADRASWRALLEMRADGWACLLLLALGVYVVGQSLNVLVIRELSATLLTSLSSLRLVVATASSYALLGEPVANWLQWLGIFTVLAAVSLYVTVQSSDDAPLPAAAGAVVERSPLVGLTLVASTCVSQSVAS